MPSRNTNRRDKPDSYYHVYSRGASKQTIFIEPSDYLYFTKLFARYLSKEPKKDKVGIGYPHYRGKVELVAYCLMQNHFHLLLYQVEQGSVSSFMKSLMSSYCRYFNLKYKRSGSIYESRHKASLINADDYLLHISRYIHLNPRYWRFYAYSSLGYYLSNREEEWLTKQKLSQLFQDKKSYEDFLRDYEDYKVMLAEIKHELAND
jgi:putative transposase